MFNELNAPGLSATQIESEGELLYILLLGIYESFEQAQQASSELPAQLAGFEPWIRRLGPLQAAMLRAEQLLPSP